MINQDARVRSWRPAAHRKANLLRRNIIHPQPQEMLPYAVLRCPDALGILAAEYEGCRDIPATDRLRRGRHL